MILLLERQCKNRGRSGTKTKKKIRGEPSPDLKSLPFHRAKTAVKFIFAGVLTGPRTI